MKKLLVTAALTLSFAIVLHAQTGPTFNKEEQAKVRQILGSDYTPVFNSQGELAITTKNSISRVRALPGGGFTKPSTSAFNNVLIHRGWIFAISESAVAAMKTKLGEERYKQLEDLMETKKPAKK